MTAEAALAAKPTLAHPTVPAAGPEPRPTHLVADVATLFWYFIWFVPTEKRCDFFIIEYLCTKYFQTRSNTMSTISRHEI